MKKVLNIMSRGFRKSLSLSLVLLMISGMSASSTDKVEHLPKLQLEQKNEQNHLPLTQKGVFERIELPLLLGIHSSSFKYFDIQDFKPKINIDSEDLFIETVNSSEPHYCTCDLPGSVPDIVAGTGTAYSSLGLPAYYNLTNKCLTISGILIIDMDVTFDGGSIIVGGSTRIIVENGNTLNLLNINEDEGVHSQCEGMWGGIDVENGATLNISNCIIQDAVHAVSLFSGSTHSIQNTQFRRNLIGIIVPSGQTLPVTINQSAPLSGNLFDCHLVNSAYMFFYIEGGVIIYPPKPYAGIVVNDATFIVGSPSAGPAANEFRLVQNGIIGVDANLSIYDVEMDDINETPQAINASPIKGFGVHTSSTLLRVERSKFIDVTTGIGTIGSVPGSFIGTSEFDGNYVGVTGFQGSLTISKNAFKNYEARAVNLDAIGGLVKENSFRAPTVYTTIPSVGVAWGNTPGYSSTLYAGRVEDNTFRLGIYGMGIQLSSCSRFRIQDNSMNYDPGYNPFPPSGIMLNNASINDVKYNQISGGLSAFGIRTLQSSDNLYCCNGMNSLRTAMAFSGACNSSKIKFNQFGNTAESSFLCGGGTLIGGQPHYRNNWTGSFSSPPPGVAHAKHDGTPFLIQSSIFEVNTCSAPLFPPTILPAQSCPSSGDWFIFMTGPNTSNCSNDVDCAYSDDGGGEESLMINENDMRYLNGDYSEEEYAGMVEWQMGKDLYQRLLRDNSLVNHHEEVADFYNSTQNTAMGHFVQIGESLKEVALIPETTMSTVESFISQIDELMTDLGHVDTEMQGDLSSEEQNILSGQRIAILADINGHQAEIASIMAAYTASAQSSYASLLSQNGSINATSDIEMMEKEVNALLLQGLINPSHVYSQNEKEYLFSVAGLCHLHYGSVVFVARSLYLRSENYHFEDDEICFPTVELKKGQEEISTIDKFNVSIMPNPATNNLNIIWKNAATINDEFTIMVMDLQGKLILSRVEKGESGNIDLDISNYAAGVYLIQGWDKTGVRFTEKVFIQK